MKKERPTARVSLSFLYGAKEIRNPDPHAASVVLYQLSYNPVWVSANIEINLNGKYK